MTKMTTIRETGPDDAPALLALYPEAFPEEDLRPLVRALLARPGETLSLAAFEKGALIGHALFSLCSVTGQSHRAALLGPVAISPPHQRRGIGAALIRDGLARMTARGVARICVLGDPGYYARFGFQPEQKLRPPYPLPTNWAEAWRSITLDNAGDPAGELRPPAPWMNPALWSE